MPFCSKGLYGIEKNVETKIVAFSSDNLGLTCSVEKPFPYRIYPIGDQAITLDFGNLIKDEINAQVMALFYWLKEENLHGIKDIIPAYSTISLVYDAALIIENGHSTRYNPLIVVSCPIEIQLARLMKRNSLTRDEAMARICSQIPTAEKIKFADYVIDSSSTIENSRTQTEQIISNLKI